MSLPRPLRAAPSLVLAGCAGLSLGEIVPGGDAALDHGAIAVDPATDAAWVLAREADGADTEARRLLRVHPEQGTRRLDPLPGTWDVRLAFPPSGVLLMAQDAAGAGETLRLLDRDTGATVRETWVGASYGGTRSSPSGRWLAVVDDHGDLDPWELHVFDTTTLEHVRMPTGGVDLEAGWLADTDVFVAVVFYGPDRDDLAEEPAVGDFYARVLAWDFRTLGPLDRQVGEDGLWADPFLSIEIPGAIYDLSASITWIVPSPDGRSFATSMWVLVGEEEHLSDVAHVVDTTTGTVTSIPHLRGPIGFSPDGTTVVGWRGPGEDGADAEVVLVDLATREETSLGYRDTLGPSYHVTRDGGLLLIAPASIGAPEAPLLLHDFESGVTVEVQGPAFHLDAFVARQGHDEVYALDAYAPEPGRADERPAEPTLFRLDLVKATAAPLPLRFAPSALNWLPGLDLLVVGDAGGPSLHFVDPDTTRTLATAPILPTP